MSLLVKIVDLGLGLTGLFLAVAAFGAWAAWQALEDRPTWRPWGAGLAFGVVLLGCAGVFDRVGQAPRQAWLVERDGVLRIVSATSTSGRGGTSCGLRAYTIDGTYVGGSRHEGGCDLTVTEGVAILHPRTGFMALGPHDRVLVDLWTGRVRDRLSSHLARLDLPGAGEVKVEAERRTGVQVLLQDGTHREIPWDGGPGARVVPLGSDAEHLARGDLFEAHRLSARCGGRVLVTHRSVAFGDGSDLLSAMDDPPSGEPAWTLDLTALWGDRRLLGVATDGGQCLLVAGAASARLWVVRVAAESGEVRSQWTN
ncbi:MAG: hypothetical protein H6737_21495 [Alphaproteobacteria bacterium]|nr:hypothetical protein [Alphaproteobacteria bacterium]